MSGLFDTHVDDLDNYEDLFEDEALIVDIEGFEGPLDLLLTLAKKQKVNLREISIVSLADQYLIYVEEARAKRLELAADYLVIAAWLTFMKSRLLLPAVLNADDEEQGMTAEEMAHQLTVQLRRLEAIRQVSQKLMSRNMLGVDFFARGEIEVKTTTTKICWTVNILELLQTYAKQRTRGSYEPLHMERSNIYTMDEALERLRSLIGASIPEWTTLQSYLPKDWCTQDTIKSGYASTFAACLELVKEGKLHMQQSESYGEIQIRSSGKRAI